MAEVFAAASAAIGVAAAAGQLIDGVIKLNAFCSEIRGIPDDIQNEVQHLSMIVDVLDAVQLELSHGMLDQVPSPGISAKLLSNLQEGSIHIQEVLQEMKSKLGNKSKWGRINAVGIKKRLEKAVVRVRNTENLLVIALTCDNRSLLREGLAISRQDLATVSRRVDAISEHHTSSNTAGRCLGATRPENLNTSGDGEEFETHIASHNMLKRPGLASGGSKFMRLNLPTWIGNQAWEFRWAQASRGWDFSIRAYRILPMDSAFFTAIRMGKIAQVRHMLSNGEATIWDRTPYNHTVLHMAAEGCSLSDDSVAILELFMRNGVDINILNNSGWPAHTSLYRPERSSVGASTQVELRLMRAYRAFLSHPNWIIPRPTAELGFDSPRPQSDIFRLGLNPPPEAIRLAMNNTYPPWNERALSDQIATLLPLNTPWEPGIYPSTLWAFLEREEFGAWFVRCRPASQYRLMVYAFKTLGHWLGMGSLTQLEEARNLLGIVAGAGVLLKFIGVEGALEHFLCLFVSDYLDACCDIDTSAVHESLRIHRKISFNSRVRFRKPRPLRSKSMVRVRGHKRAENYIQYGFKHYISELSLQGLDFVPFASGKRDIQLDYFDQQDEWLKIRVIGFALAGNRKYWHLWLSNPLDEWAAEFWDMVDHPERAIPGAWVHE